MPTPESLVTLMRPTNGRRRRRWRGRAILAVLVLAVAIGGYLGIRGVVTNFGAPSCQATALGRSESFTPEQTSNAATISAVAVRRGLPPRAATIAVATAIQESKLRNITFGDRDSLGLFQQRPSQGWGTVKQVTDPVHASGKFYDALVKVKGYETMPITEVAQEVQRSAFPEAYADHEQEGRLLASSLTGHSPGGLGCRLADPTGPGAPATVVRELKAELGMAGRASGRTVTLQVSSAAKAWSAGTWAVANAEHHGTVSVTVGDRTWTRSRDKSSWSWQRASTPVAPTSVVLRLA
jgi:hypothetical protein